MRDDRERLFDILEAIERTEKHTAIDRSSFESDELVQTWMVHHVQIIGEAAAQLSDDFKRNHHDVPWRAIAAMRNAIVHAYFRVDIDEVWSVIANDIPPLKQRILSLLESAT